MISRHMKRQAAVVAMTAFLGVGALPVSMAHEGHGAQGKPPAQLGKVTFPTSCKPAVQAEFERGVALLHSFWWQEGERAFRRVLDEDPGCTMAAWGLASILVNNTFGPGPAARNAAAAQAAIEQGRAGAGTQRERDYLEAVASYFRDFANRPQSARMKSLAEAYGQLADEYYPEDDEALIFHALYLASTQHPSDRSYAATLKAAAILESLFVKYPDHPGVAHYLIHSYDYPPLAGKGLSAARRYAAIAPSAPHALHMPSHIFTRVGAWEDSVDANLRSATTARSEGETDDQIHAIDYAVYALLQLGRDAEAKSLVEEALALDGFERMGGPFAQAAIPARYALERGDWAAAARLTVKPGKYPWTEAMTRFARALGAARLGNAIDAAEDVARLARIRDALKAQGKGYWATEVEVQRLAAAAWTAFAESDNDTALQMLRAAADLEDSSEKNVVTPGRLLPARELLGEMLLELARPREALAEFRLSQEREPNRFRGLHGAAQAAAGAGESALAREYFRKLVNMAPQGQFRPEVRFTHDFLAVR